MRYEVWLNDNALSAVDPAIVITDIAYGTVSRQYSNARIAGRAGSYSSGGYISGNVTQVSFMVRRYSTRERQDAVQRIIAWASNDGWLKTSDRVGKKIWVRCSKLPAVTSVLRWTDVLSVEFTAYDYPYWQDDARTVELSASETGTFYSSSAFDMDVEAEVTATEAITSFSIAVGDTSITLSDISIAANGKVSISYTDDHHILQIKSGTTSLLLKRTGSDDLKAHPGANTIGFTASGSATCKLIFKGVSV